MPQGLVPPPQTPPVQVCVPLQKLVSSQLVPLATKPSAGHALLTPSQLSATSQTPVDARHWAVLFASLGQNFDDPLHASVRSQTPAEARQVVPFGSTASAGQVRFVPSQVSATSHTSPTVRRTAHRAARLDRIGGQVLLVPSQNSAMSHTSPTVDPRQTVVGGSTSSAGQLAPVPVQNSAMSHTSPTLDARHTVVAGAKPSAGQVGLDPVHDSATSQTSAAPRHSVPDDTSVSAGQAVLTPSHSSATSQMPADARHVVPFGRSRSAGQSSLRSVAQFRDVAESAGRTALRRALRVRRTGVVQAIARFGDVADAGRGTALGRALRVRRARIVDAVADFSDVADAARRPALGRELRIRRTGVARAVAHFGDVADAARGPALRRALRIGRAGIADPSQLPPGRRRRPRRGRCDVLLASAGQSSPAPSHDSARSQAPTEARHCAVLLRVRRAGVARPVAALRHVADARRAAALRRALGRPPDRSLLDARAVLRHVADAARGAAHGAGSRRSRRPDSCRRRRRTTLGDVADAAPRRAGRSVARSTRTAVASGHGVARPRALLRPGRRRRPSRGTPCCSTRSVGRTGVAHAVAHFGHVADAHRAAAGRRALAVRRAGRARPGAGLLQIAGAAPRRGRSSRCC